MIRDNRQFKTVPLAGGLDLESNPLEIQPGRIISCKNFGVKSGGGYYRIPGYERFDGRPSPTDSEDTETARALIQAVPGEGAILGVWVFNSKVYAFRNNVGSTEAKMFVSSASGWSEVATGVTLSPGGRYEFENFNFYGASTMSRMYGVDGVNKAFMFDGSVFTQLTVPGEADKPIHLAAHKNHLFLAYPKGQYAHSGIGEPTAWDTVTEGAGVGGVGDEIVAIQPTVGGALAFFMRNRVSILYGSSAEDWQANDLRNQKGQSGAIRGSVQDIGGDIIYLDDRGLTSMKQTQAFGNFEMAAIDKAVRTFVAKRKQKVIASLISREANEYRLLFDHISGTEVITLTFSETGIEGYAVSIYPFKAACVCSLEDGTGAERIMIGALDGFIYQLDKGRSFDGEDIDAYIKLSYSSLGMPKHNKRFRSVQFSLDTRSQITLKVKPDFNYGSSEKAGHQVMAGDVVGGGALWGDGVWGEFVWGAQLYGESSVDITGTAKNISLMIHHRSADTLPFTIFDIILTYSVRGFIR